MTLPPEKIGDKGQPYVLQVEGYPNDGWNDCVYGSSEDRLKEAGSAFLTAPGATRARITERFSSSAIHHYIK